MNDKNDRYIWQQSECAGATESERYLAKLARRTFLSFWSYSNPCTDESGGIELCDLMVVFGENVILFSDKHCKFPSGSIGTAWSRWYRRAIQKSANQLKGAQSFITRFPKRVYLDLKCEHPLPIPLPPSDKIKVHLVAVTRGSADACKNYFGNNSSSSLILNTMIVGREHERHPFMVGWPLERGRFVHILDELTLEILLNELDTATDFVRFLQKKESFLSTKEVEFVVAGDEELLADYLSNPSMGFEEFSFTEVPPGSRAVAYEEGAWVKFFQSDVYLAWKVFNKISYEWDRLIEHQTSHIHCDTAKVLANNVTAADIEAHELVLRAMAEEGRASRKTLAEIHHSILATAFPEDRRVKTVVLPHRPGRAYVFLVLKQASDVDYDEYRAIRRASLMGFCRASRLRIRNIVEVVGVASEQSNSEGITQDFVFMRFDAFISMEEKEKEVSVLRKDGIWKSDWSCL